MAAAGKMGLNAGRSVAEAGCSFIFITCVSEKAHHVTKDVLTALTLKCLAYS